MEEFTATDVKNGRDRIRAFVAGFVPSPAALVRATVATVSLAVHLELDADDLNELLRRILAEKSDHRFPARGHAGGPCIRGRHRSCIDGG